LTPDLINGAFEFVGSLALWMNVRRLYQDKCSRGVAWPATGFFFAWALWNCWLYPAIGFWCSFAGGCSIATANLAWLWLMFLYRRN